MQLIYLVKPNRTNDMLRYSLRSVAAHLPHADVVLAGYNPAWAQGVRYLPVHQTRTEHKNQVKILRTVCADTAVEDTFVLMNDDFFAMEPGPPVVLGCQGLLADLGERGGVTWRTGWYGQALANTRDILYGWGVHDPLAYDCVHQPMPVHREVMGEALYRAGTRSVLHRSLYGNLVPGGEEVGDAKTRAGTGGRPGPWLSMDGPSWHGAAGRAVREQFTAPCRFEGFAPLRLHY